MNRRLLFIVIASSIGCGAVISSETGLPSSSSAETLSPVIPEAPLRILCLNVGEGDATLIISPDGQAALIDLGPEETGGKAVRHAMEQFGVETLKFVIATHYHTDHIGGAYELMMGDDRQPGTRDDLQPTHGFYDRGATYEPTTPAFRHYLKAAGDTRHRLHPGDQLLLGDATLEVVAADGRLKDGTVIPIDPFDENAASIVLLMSYGTFRFFLGGDITGGGGNPPYQTTDVESKLGPLIGDIDVLRVAHHGSHTSSNQRFLDTTQPEVAIISVGNGNDYFHPHPSVLDRLLLSGIRVFQTEHGSTQNGAVNVASGDVLVEVTSRGYDTMVSTRQ